MRKGERRDGALACCGKARLPSHGRTAGGGRVRLGEEERKATGEREIVLTISGGGGEGSRAAVRDG